MRRRGPSGSSYGVLDESSHHPVFSHFVPPWQGEVEAGYGVNFLGVRTRGEICPELVKPVAKEAHVTTSLPGPDDDYLEWISVLTAVVESDNEFTMIELGAGWGRWTANAALAARRIGRASRFVAVEAEPTHFRWIEPHLRESDIDLDSVQLIEAAVADTEGEAWFYVGLPDHWYGQALASQPPGPPSLLERASRWLGRARRRARAPELDAFLRSMSGDEQYKAYVERVRTVTLGDVLAPMGVVDLIHMDIQGAELDVLRTTAATVDRKVRRVHVGTHSEEVEVGIDVLFADLGWEPVFRYGLNRTHETPWGRLNLVDGVFSYVNPRLRPAGRAVER